MADLIRQCCHCRRVHHDGEWVARQVDESKMNITHGFCPACMEEHYPDYSHPTPIPTPAPPPK